MNTLPYTVTNIIPTMTLYCSLNVEVFLRHAKENWCCYTTARRFIEDPATMSAL